MKAVVSFALCSMALGFAAFVSAAPPQVFSPDLQSFNFSSPLNGTSNDTVSAIGYDPSNDYHGWATVEVWTGGGRRQPVNVGNVVGHDLHRVVSETLDRICHSPYGKYCDNFRWQYFDTPYLQTPPAGIKQGVTWFRVIAAEWANEEIREIMLNIVGRVLYAYTTQPLGTNCYEVPGQGRFCNIPQFIRLHLPSSSSDAPDSPNYWLVEFRGEPSTFSKHGNLKPCATRAAVDEQLDQYKDRLEAQFPEWKGRFKRDTRVIIDGYKVCSDEP